MRALLAKPEKKKSRTPFAPVVQRKCAVCASRSTPCAGTGRLQRSRIIAPGGKRGMRWAEDSAREPGSAPQTLSVEVLQE